MLKFWVFAAVIAKLATYENQTNRKGSFKGVFSLYFVCGFRQEFHFFLLFLSRSIRKKLMDSFFLRRRT